MLALDVQSVIHVMTDKGSSPELTVTQHTLREKLTGVQKQAIISEYWLHSPLLSSQMSTVMTPVLL